MLFRSAADFFEFAPELSQMLKNKTVHTPTVTCSKLYTGENSTTNIHMYTTPKTGRTESPFLPQNHHDQQGWHQQTNNALLYTIYLPNRSTLLPYGLILLPGQAASFLLARHTNSRGLQFTGRACKPKG